MKTYAHTYRLLRKKTYVSPSALPVLTEELLTDIGGGFGKVSGDGIEPNAKGVVFSDDDSWDSYDSNLWDDSEEEML